MGLVTADSGLYQKGIKKLPEPLGIEKESLVWGSCPIFAGEDIHRAALLHGYFIKFFSFFYIFHYYIPNVQPMVKRVLVSRNIQQDVNWLKTEQNQNNVVQRERLVLIVVL